MSSISKAKVIHTLCDPGPKAIIDVPETGIASNLITKSATILDVWGLVMVKMQVSSVLTYGLMAVCFLEGTHVARRIRVDGRNLGIARTDV